MKKIPIFVALAVCYALFANEAPAYACSPAPWFFEDAYESKAMVYGKVIETENDGRKATVDVISYVGPNHAPARIRMPETIDDRDQYPAGYSCPDFSMKFEPGEEYIFFLRDIPPNLRLLSPSYRTASNVENGQVIVGLPRGETDSLQHRLQEFARISGYPIQSPDRSSPVWSDNNNIAWLWVVFASSILSGIIYFSYKRAKR
ncbi:hypothetical protein FE782_24655 [Paenibacillus antri]|uniref:Uncharacterized protein n=1 Tax=Paenibacillus antri TaxID=2582848 RepID=A0A5R9GA48_9BACL|nr:hypothetical protein [Paenibacillus antri]TLS49583.1 hypothetical protein FE782_24655 [Paenibacillus antri]